MRSGAVALLAGLALCAACTGASDVLTSMPRAAIVLTGLACAALVLRGRAACSLQLFALGVAIGLALPRTLMQTPGQVVTHPIGTSGASDLFAVLEKLDDDPRALLGRRVGVTGTWTPAVDGAPATVSRRVMQCCAADAVAVGFDVYPSARQSAADGALVRVSGVVVSRLQSGELRYGLDRAGIETL